MTDSGLYRLLEQTTTAEGSFEVFASTEGTGSLWGPMQHGGPVAALLARAMDRSTTRTGSRLTRITVDLLGPVPIDKVRVHTQVVRPGRKIELIGSTLETEIPDGAWRAVAHGSAWRQATQATADVTNHANASRSFPTDDGAVDSSIFPDEWMDHGFVSKLNMRGASLSTREGEPSFTWMQLGQNLVQDEEISPLEHVMALADTTNGVGMRLEPFTFRFLNTEMTVHLYEEPVSDWFGIEAETSVGADGVGMSASVLHSPDGPIGRVTQSVLVERTPNA